MILLFSLLSVTESIISSTKLTLDQYSYNNFVWFGFQQGGELKVNAKLDKKYSNSKPDKFMNLYLCTPEEFSSLGSLQEDCLLVKAKKSSSFRLVNFQKTIEKYITYEIVIENNSTNRVSIEINYKLINPGGEQLSSGLLEMKYIMLIFTIAWGLLLFLWIFKWILTKHKKPTIIQTFLVMNCFVWCVFSMIFFYHLHDFSQTGKSNEDWFMASKIAMFLSLVCLFSLLEIISGGIGITASDWKRESKLKLGFKIILFTLWFLLSELHKGEYVFYLLSAIFGVFLVTYLREICKTINLLEKKMEKMMDEGHEVIESDLWHQVRMFRIHCISFMVFLALLSCISGLYEYYRYIPWVGMGTEIYIIFIWVLLLSVYFCFREKNPYLKPDSLTF
jgi:hypothetical protein